MIGAAGGKGLAFDWNAWYIQEKNLFPVNKEEHSIFLETDQYEKKFSPKLTRPVSNLF